MGYRARMECDITWFVLCKFLLLVANIDNIYFAQASECRIKLSFEKTQTNMALLNHVIKKYKVESDQMCRVKCYLNHDCVSYNLGSSQTPGMLVCQLNNADRYQYPQDYQDKPGYSYRGTENKCGENPCLSNQTCQTGFNTEGYRCLCPEGFTGEKCEIDIDECSLELHNCTVNASCSNIVGSFSCACKTGFQGDGFTCEDVDECVSNTHSCSSMATCINKIGSYKCVCNSGWHGNGVTCTDINECSLGLHNCSVNASCSNTLGSFNCSCDQGFQGDGYKCDDSNECALGTHNCSSKATCTNKIGSFGCSCLPGWHGNGVTCAETDECSRNTHNCSVGATCTNIVGSFRCACNQGFHGDGYECDDINECTRNLTICSGNTNCQNSFGSYACACNPGFQSNGVTCIEKWIKASYSGPTVCVETKGNSFGVFAVPFTGKVKQFKLMHVSGGVCWGGGSRWHGTWGDKFSKRFEIHITSVENHRIAPPATYPLTNAYRLQYVLPGQSFMDPQLLFPEFASFLNVQKNQLFRIWYGGDLNNYKESYNSGKTCSNVYVMYAEYE